MLAVLGAYVSLWALYGVVAKSSQDINYDSAEVVAWSREFSLGYAKHPPLAAWLVRSWFSLFPETDWAYYLLAMTSTGVALWFAWQVFKRYCSAEKSVLAFAFLTFVPFYNFHALKFDHNTILVPLWAATTFWFLRSFETGKTGWAALAGAGAAAAMLAKYWSIYLVVGLALAAALNARRGLYFRSAAPWITAAVGTLLLAPHVAWLIAHDFSPMVYALDAHELSSLPGTLVSIAGYLVGAAGYVTVPTLLVLIASRPDVKAVRDALWPQSPTRTFASTAFWAPLLLPVAVALAARLELNSMWSMAGLTLLPVILLSSPLVSVGQLAVRRIVALAVVLPLSMIIAAPGIAIVVHRAGAVSSSAAHGHLLAAELEKEWQHTTDRPLRLVGGDLDLTYVTAFYLSAQPSTFLVGEPHLSPWVDLERVDREGIVMTCYARDNLQNGETCVHKPVIDAMERIVAHGPPGRRVVVELKRSYLGMAGKPTRYIIMTVPPRT